MTKKFRSIWIKLIAIATLVIHVSHDFITDAYKLIDEKKIWGFIFLVLAQAELFRPQYDFINFAYLLAFALTLSLGAAVGNRIAPLAGLKSLGFLDLVTNKANQKDPYRLFGNFALVATAVYTILPLVSSSFVASSEPLGFIGSIGVSLLTAAVYADKRAVKVTPPINTDEPKK